MVIPLHPNCTVPTQIYLFNPRRHKWSVLKKCSHLIVKHAVTINCLSLKTHKPTGICMECLILGVML